MFHGRKIYRYRFVRSFADLKNTVMDVMTRGGLEGRVIEESHMQYMRNLYKTVKGKYVYVFDTKNINETNPWGVGEMAAIESSYNVKINYYPIAKIVVIVSDERIMNPLSLYGKIVSVFEKV